MAEKRTWEWKVEAAFNPRYDATASEEGVEYYCEIQGPFCGYDREGSQTWAEFFAEGPPAKIGMPGAIADAIRDYARELGRNSS
jgi:hypothetical protein